MVSMMYNLNSLVLLFIVITIKGPHTFVTCWNITHAENLHTYLLTGYNKDVRPIINQDQILNVTVKSFVRSVQDLDEITGELSFTGAIQLNWNDENMIWDPVYFGDIGHTLIAYGSVWVPELIITTTTDKSDTMAKKWQKVRYENFGLATLVVGDRILASCNLDVQKYPFDSQTCEVRFTMWGYDMSEVGVVLAASAIDLSQYSGNSVWDLPKTETKTVVIEGWAYYIMVFHFERKSSFTVINLIAPILLLSFLNVMVFLLVPDSGERISYSVTVLLAVAVFMTIISDVLPQTSDPVPIITYKLMVDMIISVLITLITILNLRLYHKDENQPVPRRLATLYRFFRCGCCRNGGTGLEGNKVDTAFENNGVVKITLNNKVDLKNDGISSIHGSDDEVTWKKLSYMVDYISLVVFSIAYFLSFVVYFAKTRS